MTNNVADEFLKDKAQLIKIIYQLREELTEEKRITRELIHKRSLEACQKQQAEFWKRRYKTLKQCYI